MFFQGAVNCGSTEERRKKIEKRGGGWGGVGWNEPEVLWLMRSHNCEDRDLLSLYFAFLKHGLDIGLALSLFSGAGLVGFIRYRASTF